MRINKIWEFIQDKIQTRNSSVVSVALKVLKTLRCLLITAPLPGNLSEKLGKAHR